MKILVLNPPFLPLFSRASRSPAVAKSGTLYYPMWLAYAVGYLEKNGHEVLFLDAPAAGLSVDEVLYKASAFKPALAILDSSTPSIYNDCDVAGKIKTATGAFTLLVGVHVSALPEKTLAETAGKVDAVAVGEYDATVLELATALESSSAPAESFGSVAGLAWRNGDAITINQRRNYLENLDDLPFVSSVYKKHLSIEPYFYGHSRHPIVVLVTGRGCPFQCSYCVLPQTMMGHKYRKRSIESVVAEFRYIAENFPQAQEIMIEDDTLTADRERCRAFSRALIEQKLTHIPWSANSRADVDVETMKLMKKAGCRLFCVGFESGEQAILDAMGKSLKLNTARVFVRDAKKAGILVHGCFMVGNPDETKTTIESTLKLAKELNPDTAQFYPIMVYPGTRAFEHFSQRGWITTTDYRKWITEEGLHSSVVSNPDLTYEYLVAFCNRARQEFYLRPSYILQKLAQIITSPSEANRIFKASKTFFRYLLKGWK